MEEKLVTKEINARDFYHTIYHKELPFSDDLIKKLPLQRERESVIASHENRRAIKRAQLCRIRVREEEGKETSAIIHKSKGKSVR